MILGCFFFFFSSMDNSVSVSKRKRNYIVFLNISFIFASCVLLILHFHYQEPSFLFKNTLHLNKKINNTQQQQEDCKELQRLKTHEAKCSYLKSKQLDSPCVSQGYIDYLSLFFCKFGSLPFMGYSLLFLLLLILFYLLGNTASEYFCSSLESLSNLFNLSPTIAGVTLLSLGNGAPDVFSSLVSFMGSGNTSEIGLNTVLGGASFVSCVVVGVISVVMHYKRCVVQVNKVDFVRDVFFLLLILLCLTVILVQRQIDLWGSITFFSIYVVYVIVVYFLHMRSKNDISGDDVLGGSGDDVTNQLTIPILGSLEKGELNNNNTIVDDEEIEIINERRWFANCGKVVSILEFPLYLPRRLTIPVISEEKWSKFYAVASVALAPILLAILGSHQIESYGGKLRLAICGFGVVLGVSCGVAVYVTTERLSPPKKFVLPWLAAGFLMSVTWSYITAQELVGLLISLAYIFGLSPSILGLTILAWGNSIGDLVTNLTMALNGGPEGVQTAFSGCYAGPIFNILFGLGSSLTGYCWSKYPSSLVIPKDHYSLQTLGFLAAGLFWALLVLPRKGMRLDGVFGGGLLVIYIVSISLSLFQALRSSQAY